LGEKSGAIALVLPGLMAGRLADKIVLNLKFFKSARILKNLKFKKLSRD